MTPTPLPLLLHLPVPQALSVAWHAEAIPVVGEVTVDKEDKEDIFFKKALQNGQLLQGAVGIK